MNDIFIVVAFLVLVGLLVSRMAREQREESAYGEPLDGEGTQLIHSDEQELTRIPPSLSSAPAAKECL